MPRLLLAAAPGAVALVLAVVALANGPETEPAVSADVATAAPTDAGLSLEALFDRVDGAVGRIDAYRNPSDPPFGNGRRDAIGAGFLTGEGGYVVTNAHVVQGARRVTIRFGRSARRVPARIVGRDDATDLAVLRVKPAAVEDERPLRLAAAGSVRVGEPVLAVGTPYRLQSSASAGIVSATRREIRGLTGFTIADAVQTDAAINPGNSGGPLMDAEGAVVGVNSQGRAPGVSFAVSAATVRRVMPQLIEDGRADAPFLGISAGQVTATGTEVEDVTDDGPAERAGVRDGDVVVELAGRPATTDGALTSAIASLAPGDREELRVRRDGDERTLTVTIGRQPR